MGFEPAAAPDLERPPPFLDGGGTDAEDEAGEISLKMPPKVWARVRT